MAYALYDSYERVSKVHDTRKEVLEEFRNMKLDKDKKYEIKEVFLVMDGGEDG